MKTKNHESEVRSGPRHLLAKSQLYDAFQHAVGAYKWRQRVVKTFILPLCKPSTRILDIGCGTGEILSYLPAQSKYFGFDRNQDYIDHAKRRFSNKNAEFVCEDVNSNTVSTFGKFDIVLAIGIIHHLEDALAEELFDIAHRALNEGGTLLTLDPVYTLNQSFFAKYVVGKDRGQAVRTDSEYLKIAQTRFERPELLIDSRPLRIPYTGIVMNCIKQQDNRI